MHRPHQTAGLRKGGRRFISPSMLLLLLLCNGCFTTGVSDLCGRIHNEIEVLERRGEVSNDGQHLEVYLKKQTTYCRPPFRKRRVVEESTHVYSLTTPEPGALQKEFLLSLKDDKGQRIHLQSYEITDGQDEITDGQETAIGQNEEVNLGRLILPRVVIYPCRREGTRDIYSTLSIHPDDAHFLTQPFVWESFHWYQDNTLVIPYQQEGDILKAYCPKEDLIGPKQHRVQETIGAWALFAVLTPPALVLDVVTFPVQCVAFYVAFQNMDWH